MLLSSKGYGILWNNYGLVDFNPCDHQVKMRKLDEEGQTEVVNVTTTEGGRREVRQRNIYEATIDIADDGDYAILLDVGQQMARRHNLSIDGQNVIEMQNMWLPPTASTIVRLKAGHHVLKAELSRGDSPVIYYNKVKDETVFRSPIATAVDYTVFVGSPDEIISTVVSVSIRLTRFCRRLIASVVSNCPLTCWCKTGSTGVSTVGMPCVSMRPITPTPRP